MKTTKLVQKLSNYIKVIWYDFRHHCRWETRLYCGGCKRHIATFSGLRTHNISRADRIKIIKRRANRPLAYDVLMCKGCKKEYKFRAKEFYYEDDQNNPQRR